MLGLALKLGSRVWVRFFVVGGGGLFSIRQHGNPTQRRQVQLSGLLGLGFKVRVTGSRILGVINPKP